MGARMNESDLCATCGHPRSVHFEQRIPSRLNSAGWRCHCGIREIDPAPCYCRTFDEETKEAEWAQG